MRCRECASERAGAAEPCPRCGAHAIDPRHPSAEQRPGPQWIARHPWANVLATSCAWIFALSLIVWSLDALGERHALVGAFIWLAVVAVLLPWTLHRAWRFGVRCDEHGVMIANVVRTYRAGWAEVESFADGSTNGRDWALAVMLRDGRGITATATRGWPGSPEIVTALRRAAHRYQVPAALTGVGTERPRAWRVPTAEAGRQAAWYRAWLAVMVIAAAGAGPLAWLGVTREGDPSGVAGVFACLAVLSGCVAVAGVVAAHAAWRSRRQALGLQPVQDSYSPGCWFAMPLPKGAGFRPGLVTRAEPRQDGILLCYFFPPSGTAVPALDELRELRPADAILVAKMTSLGKKWPKLGQAPGWDRSAWPVPAFRPDGRQRIMFVYGDDLQFIRQEVPGPEHLSGLHANDPWSPDTVAERLKRLPGKPA